jgi:hypothetical protein
MAASLHRLRSKEQRLRLEQGAALRQLILEFPGGPERAVGELVACVDRHTASQNGWTFVMLSAQQNEVVVSWLLFHSSRPQKAVHLWAILFSWLRMDSGEIMLTRDEMADHISERPDKVSEIMRELESIGAISRRRERVPGMRGPGVVRYFMNPNVGTHLTGVARDKAQAASPKLRVVAPAG